MKVMCIATMDRAFEGNHGAGLDMRERGVANPAGCGGRNHGRGGRGTTSVAHFCKVEPRGVRVGLCGVH